MTAPQRRAVSYWQEQDTLRRQQEAQEKQDAVITIPGAQSNNINFQQRQQEIDQAGPRRLNAQLASNALQEGYRTKYQQEKALYDQQVADAAAARAKEKAQQEITDAFNEWVKSQPKGPVYNPEDFWVEKGDDGGWIITPKAGSAPPANYANDPGQQTGTGTGPVYQNDRYNQIANWARQAGWGEADIPMVIAIAMAESGGQAHGPDNVNPDSHNSRDMGLMQINSYWQRDKLGPGVDIYNPITNLQIAKQAYDEGGWNLWSTYKNGAYQDFLQAGTPGRVPVYSAPWEGPPTPVQTTNGMRMTVVNNAKQYIGLSYVWGGENLQTGVDCSGFVNEIYEQVGIDFARTADELSRTVIGYSSPISKLRPGDLVAWQGGAAYGPDYRGHIAIYAGNNQIVEASGSAHGVRVRSLGSNESVLGIALYLPGDKTRPTGIAAGSVARPSGIVPGSTPVNITPWNGNTSYRPPASVTPSQGGGYLPPATNRPSGMPVYPRPPVIYENPPAPKPKPKPKPKPRPRSTTRGGTGGAQRPV